MKLVRMAAFAIAAFAATPSFAAQDLRWSEWGDDLFSRATAEKRFVILDLEAVWCHWCHVMESTTYADPEVKELIAAKYLPVVALSLSHAARAPTNARITTADMTKADPA